MDRLQSLVRTLAIAACAALGLFWLSGPVAAQSTACPKTKLKLQYDIKAEQPVLSHKLSLALLQKYKKQALIGHQGKGWQLRGFHNRRAKSNYRWQNQYKRIGRTDCIVGMTFRFNYRMQHAIHVASDYPKGSCEYRVIFEHEKQHAKYEMHVLKKNEQRLKTMVRNAVVKNLRKPKDKLEAAVNRAVEAFWVVADRQAAALHGKIDTPENYAREAAKCSNW